MPIDEDTLAEVAAALTEANDAITRAAQALAGATEGTDAKREDPQALAASVNRGY